MMRTGLALKTIWFGVQSGIQIACAGILVVIENMVNGAIELINGLISALNIIPGVEIPTIEKKTFGTDAMNKALTDTSNRAKELASDEAAINKTEKQLNETRADRVKNRKKLTAPSGMSALSAATSGGAGGGGTGLDKVTGNSNSGKNSGGKAVKTTSTDKNLLSDEDVKLLLDVATKSYKVNYQQITPNVNLTFGDVRETADVDDILDAVADQLEQKYYGSLEVSNA